MLIPCPYFFFSEAELQTKSVMEEGRKSSSIHYENKFISKSDRFSGGSCHCVVEKFQNLRNFKFENK